MTDDLQARCRRVLLKACRLALPSRMFAKTDQGHEYVDVDDAAAAATEAQRHERRHCVWCLTPHYDAHPELCDGCRAARPTLKEAMA